MSHPKAVWDTLSAINVNDHTNDKNGFTYLSWSWAWATLQEHYPNSTYKFQPLQFMPNGSCEVWVELTVEGVTREMWLAVTDFRNKPIANPSCDLVANARMRCLVKACAMFGLGHYIYAGESLPQPVQELVEPFEKDNAVVKRFEAAKDKPELQAIFDDLMGQKIMHHYVDAKNQAKERLGI